MPRPSVAFKTRQEVKRFIEDMYSTQVRSLILINSLRTHVTQEAHWLVFTESRIICYLDVWTGDWDPKRPRMEQKERVAWQMDVRDLAGISLAVKGGKIVFTMPGGQTYSADFDPLKVKPHDLETELRFELKRLGVAESRIPPAAAHSSGAYAGQGRYLPGDQDVSVGTGYDGASESDDAWTFDTAEFRNLLTQMDIRLEGLARMVEGSESFFSIGRLRKLLDQSHALMRAVDFSSGAALAQNVRNIINLRKILMLMRDFRQELDILHEKTDEAKVRDRLERIQGVLGQLETNFIYRIQEHDREYRGESGQRKCMKCFEPVQPAWTKCPSCGSPL